MTPSTFRVDVIEPQDWGAIWEDTRESGDNGPTSLSRLYSPRAPGLGTPPRGGFQEAGPGRIQGRQCRIRILGIGWVYGGTLNASRHREEILGKYTIFPPISLDFLGINPLLPPEIILLDDYCCVTTLPTMYDYLF